MFHSPITPRAAEARIAQLTCGGYREVDAEAVVDGRTLEFTAFMDIETDRDRRYSDTDADGFGFNTSYTATLKGAWAYDDADNLMAGNRAEIIDLIGEAEVRRWEWEAAEAQT